MSLTWTDISPIVGVLVGAYIGIFGNYFLQRKNIRKEWIDQVRSATARLLAEAYYLELRLHHPPLMQNEYNTSFLALQNAHHILASLLNPKDKNHVEFLDKCKAHWAVLTQGISFNNGNVTVSPPPSLPPVELIYGPLQKITD